MEEEALRPIMWIGYLLRLGLYSSPIYSSSAAACDHGDGDEGRPRKAWLLPFPPPRSLQGSEYHP